MSEDRSYIDQNTRERERLRGLVDRLWPRDPSPLYPVRAAHRGEHLDDVEAAIRSLT